TDAVSTSNLMGSRITRTALTTVDAELITASAEAYPNPFIDDINLKVNFTKNISKFSVSVTDMAGKTIHTNQFSNIPAGLWQNKIGLKGRSLKSGIYLIHIVVPGEKPRTIKVIK
ncbi:MAG: T9SS type A sorting domain-containing protein, partial [Ginsengibacter sp.]